MREVNRLKLIKALHLYQDSFKSYGPVLVLAGIRSA
jgi:hypothetical protein